MFLCRENNDTVYDAFPSRCISRQSRSSPVECAELGTSVLSAAHRASAERRSGHFKERRDKNRLFCCASTLPQRSTLFRIVSCTFRKPYSVCKGSLCRRIRLCRKNRCMLPSTASRGQILLARESVSLAFGKVPELSKVTKKY